jgi:hypothetical protein
MDSRDLEGAVDRRHYYQAGKARDGSPLILITADWLDGLDEAADLYDAGQLVLERLCATGLVLDREDNDGVPVLQVPARYEVCSLCSGKGRHVNPSIDAHGLSGDDFADDPDFAESYSSGVYDVECYRCKGQNVEPVIDEARCSPLQLALWRYVNGALGESRREAASQARYGW